MDLIDSHCHFDFQPLQTAECWARCKAAGISGMIVPGVAVEQWQNAIDCTDLDAKIYFAAGIHPWWAEKSDSDFQPLINETLNHPKCVAIGECGLDGAIDFPLEQQLPVFKQHLLLAKETERPLIIHSVKAHNEVIRQLKAHKLPAGGVIHAFTGSYEIARTYWDMGFYLGIGGSITYPRARKTRDAVARMPMESLLLETDAPDMPINGRQGETNSPEFLMEIACELAELKKTSVGIIACTTRENTFRLFKKMQRF